MTASVVSISNTSSSVRRYRAEEVGLMSPRAFTFADYLSALKELGIQEGSTVVVHSELTTLGKLGPAIRSKADLADFFISGLLDVLGEQGTLVVPTFTYSFTKKEIYDPEASVPSIGLMPERILKWPGVFRSMNPMFSYAALGPRSEEVLDSNPDRCFGPGSLNWKLIHAPLQFAFLGTQDLQMITALHSVEFEMGAPYRYTKTFDGQVRWMGTSCSKTIEFYVRDIEVGYVADFTRVQAQLYDLGKVRRVGLGWGQASLYEAQDIQEQAKVLYKNNPKGLVRLPK